MSLERQTCPVCGQLTIIPIFKDEIAEDTTCQNPECRITLNKESRVIGRWTEGYKEYQPEPSHA